MRLIQVTRKQVLACLVACVMLFSYNHFYRIKLQNALNMRGAKVQPQVYEARALTEIARKACKRPPTSRHEILMWIASLLQEHKIEYALHFGTQLGAIHRHDIIPWTCDVDILVPSLFNSNRNPSAKRFFQRLVCDDSGGAAPDRCAPGWCAFGSVGTKVFHIRFNASTMEVCPNSKKSVYMDIYSTMKRGNYETNAVQWPRPKSEEDLVANPSHYLFGSKTGVHPRGVFLSHKDIFPINKTGAVIRKRHYPSVRHPELLMQKLYGKHWDKPDPRFDTSMCKWGWCWTGNGLEYMERNRI